MDASMASQAIRSMTIEQFLSWQVDQEQRYELVDGQPVERAEVKFRHDRVTGNALSEIRRQLRACGSPCDAFTADIGIRTPVGNIRRSDVSVICPPFDEEAITSDRPRLVVEVLSESTERLDRLVKPDEYKAIPSLAYVVVIEPARVEAGLWSRDAAGAWHGGIARDPAAVLAMPDLSLSISLATLYERVLLQ